MVVLTPSVLLGQGLLVITTHPTRELQYKVNALFPAQAMKNARYALRSGLHISPKD